MGKKEKPKRRRRRREESGGIQSEMKIDRGRREDEGREKYETLRKILIIFSGLSKHKNKEGEDNKAGKYCGGKT